MEKFLIALWVLLSPTQLSKFFWPEATLAHGVRMDLLAPVLYLQDLVAIAIVFINLKFPPRLGVAGIGGLLLVILGLVFSSNPVVSGFKYLRWIVWILVAVRIYKNKDWAFWALQKIIPIWITLEFVLCVIQVAIGGSLGGVYWLLGERRFSYLTPGVALQSAFGDTIVRAYGTFSHPNSLAGFVGLALILFKKENLKFKILTQGVKSGINLRYWVVWWMGIVVMLLAGSRWVVISFILVNLKFLPRLGVAGKKENLKYLVLLIPIFYFLFTRISGWDSHGVAKRLYLTQEAVNMIISKPIFGVGLGNFVGEIKNLKTFDGVTLLQPVHNIFLLLLAEVGVVGTYILFKILVTTTLLRKNSELPLDRGILWPGIVFVFLTGMVDHYWLTLPQNMAILLIYATMVYDQRSTYRSGNTGRVKIL